MVIPGSGKISKILFPVLHVNSKITIGQTTFNSIGFNLHQRYNGHASFDFHINISTQEQMNVSLISQLLGQKVTIEVWQQAQVQDNRNEKSSLFFLGFVDSISPSWSPLNRSLQVSGYGKSFLYDTTPYFRSFVDVTLSEIIETVKQSQYPEIKTNAGDTKFSFVMQNQETDYQFLSRICDQKGLLLIYSIDSFHIGKAGSFGNDKKSVELTLGRNLSHVDLSLNTAPLDFNMSSYNYVDGRTKSLKSNLRDTHQKLSDKIVQQSRAIYPSAKLVLNELIDTTEDLEHEVQKVLGQQASNLIRLHGRSSELSLKVGQKITIKDGDLYENDEMFEHGKFVVTQISHMVSSDGSYSNTLTGIPAGFELPFRMNNYHLPKTGSISAIVTNTADPEQLGRVAVRFINDQNNEAKELGWLRVLQPYTGRGGWFFIPEVGDHVIVSCEEDHIENQPFVMGTFYQGSITAENWNAKDNSVKGFMTDKVSFKIDDRSGLLKIEADQIEFSARSEITIDGGHQLTQKATRIDLN